MAEATGLASLMLNVDLVNVFTACDPGQCE